MSAFEQGKDSNQKSDLVVNHGSFGEMPEGKNEPISILMFPKDGESQEEVGIQNQTRNN